MNFFEIKDKTGRKIILPNKQGSHIRQRHPNVDFHIIEEALTTPIRIIQVEEGVAVYYLHLKHRKEPARFLKVLVKYLNGEGYVITSYFVKDML